MFFSLKIAWRYFFSKSKQTVINRINGFAFFMVVVATAALFIVLSAFAGLKDFGLSFTNTFDPDFKLVPEQGTYFTVSDDVLSKINSLPQVIASAPEIEEKVFLSYKEKNQVAYLKAVRPDYTTVVPADRLIALGEWLSFEGPDVVVGFGIAGSMTLGIYDYSSFLNITVPKKRQNTLLNQDPFTSSPSVVSGLFQISEDLDKKYLFSSAAFGQELLSLEKNQYSSVVIKSSEGIIKETLLKEIAPFFEVPVRLVSREEQHAALYRMLNVEQLALYFIFSLVMVIALFNVVGALIMMILDKREQLKIMLALGADSKSIHRIFFVLGLLICGIGGAVGLLFGGLLVYLQSKHPFIFVPGTRLSYPVLFEWENLLIVLITLMFLGSLSTAWATRGLSKKVFFYTSSSPAYASKTSSNT
jgi:lipoprotein-releasing system permease protein